MRDHDDAGTLLSVLAHNDLDGEFDPDSPYARASLERILAEPPLPRGRHSHARARRWRRPARRLAYAAIPVGLAAALAFAVVPSLTGPSSGLAQAAVLAHAAQALQQSGSILDLQVQNYRNGGGICIPAAQSAACIGFGPGNATAGISADPSQDTLTDSYQEWVSPDGSIDHTLFNNGDEMLQNTSTGALQTYDATSNTLLTLTAFDEGAPPAPSDSTPLPIPSPANLQDPSYYESLYQQAQSGAIDATLVGQTTIDGESVYELQFDFKPVVPADPPPGDMCGDHVCTPPDQVLLLYLDSQTFTPVRTVTQLDNSIGDPGVPPGLSVSDVSDFSVQSLPDTAANQALLAMGAHTGATQIQETGAQWRSALGARLQASVAANAAKANGGVTHAKVH